MTNEEAKELLVDIKGNIVVRVYSQYVEALDLAIKALELVNNFEMAHIITDGRLNGRTSAYKCGLMDGLRLSGEKIKLEFMAESERDCKTCKHSINGNCAGTEECHECMWDSKYEQQPKIGYWKWQLADNGWADHICSECGFKHNTDIHVTLNWKYCPNCGADMRGSDEE